jgi:hypothetical protein
MPRDFKPLATALYGLAVIASGLVSTLGQEGGKAGLWFGLVMGGLALAASALLWMNCRITGAAVAWLAVGFVGGWFVYDAFIKRGFAQGDFRMYLMIALSLLEAVALCLPTRPKQRPPAYS